jgi:hypothetical protein
VVLAGQDSVLAIVFHDNWEGSVPADVVETSDSTLSILDEKEIETSFSVTDPRASLLKSHLVGEQDPFLREDGPSLKFIDIVGLVPR